MTDPSNTSVTAQFGAGERGDPIERVAKVLEDHFWRDDRDGTDDGQRLYIWTAARLAIEAMLLVAPAAPVTSVKDGGGATTSSRAENYRRALVEIEREISYGGHTEHIKLIAKDALDADGARNIVGDLAHPERLQALSDAASYVSKAGGAACDHIVQGILCLAPRSTDTAQAPEQPTGSDAVADGAVMGKPRVVGHTELCLFLLPFLQQGDFTVEALVTAILADFQVIDRDTMALQRDGA